MDLQISVFLLFILFTAGHSLSCNVCLSGTCAQTTCSSGSNCLSLLSADPTNPPNGNKCYYCDGQNCSKVLSCSGSQDRCITSTGTLANQTMVVKGCISKSFCDAASVSSVGIGDFTCCEGNLCNGAQSVTQSVLFLCCSLLSYFLMH